MRLKYHCAIFGATQSGKTFKALQLMQNQVNKSTICIFINTKYEKRYTTNNKRKKYVNRFDYNADSFLAIDDILKNPKYFAGKMSSITPNLHEDLVDGLVDVCKKILFYLIEVGSYQFILCVDELQEYVGTQQTTKGKMIRRAFIQGLGLDLRIIFTSQGWSLINKNMRNNCEMKVFLKQEGSEITEMKRQGYIPAGEDLVFDKPYKAYIRMGIGGSFREC